MTFLYNIFIQSYFIAIRIAALWNKKAADWIAGRRDLFVELKSKIGTDENIIWMHCSSAGEFEQGKPLIEALKREWPSYKILVSFFSPSGYNTAKAYSHADVITYLPLDTKGNAQLFLQLVKPKLVIFIKYEFWYHHLQAVASRNIPLLLVSATFREDQIFFKSYGRFFRRLLFLFQHIFVQDQSSFDLLQKNGITHASISGDTRFDRVKEIKEQLSEIALIEEFIGGKKVIIAGSTWEGDEKLLGTYLMDRPDVKLILAPHEISASHVASLIELFPGNILYSAYKNSHRNEPQVLLVDSIGLLSRLYQYATVTYVGGGFTKDGIHNILEAAVWNKPVVFGPNYKKYREAKELLVAGGGFSINTSEDLKKLTDDLFKDENRLQTTGSKAGNYVMANTGGTKKILGFIQEKRLLTNP